MLILVARQQSAHQAAKRSNYGVTKRNTAVYTERSAESWWRHAPAARTQGNASKQGRNKKQ
jgi:hypothetical protein